MRRFYLAGLLLLALIAVLAFVIWQSSRGPSAADQAQNAALSYARSYMAWSSGPQVQSLHIVPLRDVEQTVRAYVRVPYRDVKIGDLLAHHNPARRIAVVDLHGVFNTLPPDEGVVAPGDVLVLVDAGTDKVLLLTL
ncbi:MAG TPA: hypothetical protein VF898_01050 [Chloroflexota bacterium]